MDEITSRLLIHLTANCGDSEQQALTVGRCSVLKVSVCKQLLLMRCEHVSLVHSLAPTPVQFYYLFGPRPNGKSLLALQAWAVLPDNTHRSSQNFIRHLGSSHFPPVAKCVVFSL